MNKQSEIATTVAAEIIAIGAIVEALKEGVAAEALDSTPTPIVAAPGSWLLAVAKEYGQEDGLIPASIHCCDVLQEDSLDEPVMITHDEKVYRVRQAVIAAAAAETGKRLESESVLTPGQARALHLLRQSVKH